MTRIPALTRIPAFLRTTALASACAALLMACQGDPTAAINARDAKPQTAQVKDGGSLLSLADRISAGGDPAAAIPLYRRASDARPRAAEPLLGLGHALAATGQFAEARQAYEDAVARNPKNPAALAALGNMLLQTGRTDEAMTRLDAALALDPALPEALRGKATALDLLGRHDDALALYAAALASAPGDARTLNNYGLSLALHGATDEGIRALEDALRAPGAGAAQRQNLALAYLLRGREADARKLLAIDSGQAGAEHRLQDLYRLTGLPPQGRLAALVQGGRGSLPATPAPEGLNAQQVAALRVIGADRVAVAELPAEAPAPNTPALADITPAATTAAMPAQPALRKTALSTPALATGKASGKVWTVQLAAYRKDSQLSGGWSRFTAQYNDLLGGLSPQRAAVDFGDGQQGLKGVYYRLNAGPLPTRAAAEALCAKLQARGAACMVRSAPAAPLQMASLG